MFWMSGIEVKQCYVNEYLKTGSPGRKNKNKTKQKTQTNKPKPKTTLPIHSFCQLLWYKNTHHGQFQAIVYQLDLTEP